MVNTPTPNTTNKTKKEKNEEVALYQRKEEIRGERKRVREEESNCEGSQDKRSQIQNKITGGVRRRGETKSRTKSNSHTVTFNFQFQRLRFPNRFPCWIQNSSLFPHEGERQGVRRRGELDLNSFELVNKILGWSHGYEAVTIWLTWTCDFTWLMWVRVCMYTP